MPAQNGKYMSHACRRAAAGNPSFREARCLPSRKYRSPKQEQLPAPPAPPATPPLFTPDVCATAAATITAAIEVQHSRRVDVPRMRHARAPAAARRVALPARLPRAFEESALFQRQPLPARRPCVQTGL